MGRVVRVAVVAVLSLVILAGGGTSASAVSPFSRPAGVARELVDERTAESRTWEMLDGARVTQVASGPVQWKDGQGQWHDFDLAPTPAAGGWLTSNAGVDVRLPNHLDGGEAGAVSGLPPFSWTVGGLRSQVSSGCC